MKKFIKRKFQTRQIVEFGILVRVTGCGCPVDTSVCNTEAPTEAAAETLNLRLPLAVPDDSKLPFLACRPLRHFTLAASSTGCARVQCLTPRGQSAADKNSIIQKKNPNKANALLGFLVRVTGLEPAAS